MRSYDEFCKTAGASYANMTSWGKDKDKNILYITGFSGSGKSTLARKIANGKANIIHLDPYFEKDDMDDPHKDTEFNKHLAKRLPDYKEIADPKTMKRHSKEWWNKVDNLMSETEEFARIQHGKGKKVIVEGVQLNDDTTYPNKDFFKDKPTAVLNTGALRSYLRAARRDEKKPFKSMYDAKRYAKWYSDARKNLKKLKKITGAKRTFKSYEVE